MAYGEGAVKTERREHTLSLTGREKLRLSGVEDVAGFDDDCVVLTTSMGELSIHGSALHVERIDLDAGELILSGKISELSYSDREVRSGLLARLFG